MRDLFRKLAGLVLVGGVLLANNADAQCTVSSSTTNTWGGASRNYVLCSNTTSWATAVTNCAALPGGQWKLVTIDNLTEDTNVAAFSGNNKWIGYNDTTTENTFVWTGLAPSGSYVNASFTGNSNNNDCTRQDAGGGWTVRQCGNNNESVCEDSPRCGNGVVSSGEACDDGNTTSGDGCSATCAVEYSYTCSNTTVPSTCTPSTNCANIRKGGLGSSEYVYCGVTNQNWTQASTYCHGFGTGWELATITTEVENDFIYNMWTADGNRGTSMFNGCRDITADGNALSDWRWLSDGTPCKGAGAVFENWGPGEPNNGNPTQGCGTFWTGVPYQWDDFLCTNTVPFVCEGPPTCGDGIRAPSAEACDDGNVTNGDGCSSTCTIETVPVCGNGVITGAEACDDGNLTAGDGCSAACTIEAGYTCSGAPSTCTATCAAPVWVSRSATNSTEYFRCNTTGAWGVARNSCANLGTGWNLVTLDDGTENSFVQTSVLGGGNRWIGANDTNTEGTYAWASGTAFGGYTNWAAGEPSSAAATEDCGLMLSASGTWDIQLCANALGYVCEGPPICGNGVLGSGEGCDDGNSVNGDGCSSSCVVEAGYTCTNSSPSTASTCTRVCTATPTWSSYVTGPGLQTTEYYYCTTAVSWTNAQTNCAGVGTGWGMATISGGTSSMTAAQENAHISNATTALMWIGLNDNAVEGTYRWSSDNSLLGAYTNWAATQPDNSGGGAGSDCVAMNNVAAGTWDDLVCTTTHGYVCEGPPLCGNGVMASPQGCDDGNLNNGDGCSSTCSIETGFGCSPTNPSVCTVISDVDVSSIAAYLNPSGPGIVIEWVGLFDPTNLSFDVTVTRPGVPDEIRVNTTELEGTGLTGRKTAYWVVDPEGTLDDRYWILENKFDGTQTRYAAITPTAERPTRLVLPPGVVPPETGSGDVPLVGCSTASLASSWEGLLMVLSLAWAMRRRSRKHLA